MKYKYLSAILLLLLLCTLCSCGSGEVNHPTITVPCYECGNALTFEHDYSEDGTIYYYCTDTDTYIDAANSGCPVCTYKAGWNDLYWDIESRIYGDWYMIDPGLLREALYDELGDSLYVDELIDRVVDASAISFEDINEMN